MRPKRLNKLFRSICHSRVLLAVGNLRVIQSLKF